MTDQNAFEHLEEEIAIVGMAGRFPGASDLATFWQNLRDGVESIVFFSDQELEAAGVSPLLLRNPQYVKARPVLADIDAFDATFFGYSPREAEIMDPQHRLFLECCWEALENAGYDSWQCTDRSVGVYAGVSMSSYMLFNLLYNRDRLKTLDHVQAVISNDKDHLPTRVSYKLNLKGPSININTACSSSLVSVHLACESLLNGECDMALAGGASITAAQTSGYYYQPGGIFSPDGHCRAFDARAQGTVFGSGVGVVVLKRLKDALQEGDAIQAIIKGSAINNDGSAKVGYSAPGVDGQAEVIAKALAMAEVAAESITYVETHGTGTALGDPIEVAALTQAFRAQTSRVQFCALGSLKTNIGHLDAASGVAGLIKTVLALQHHLLPPSLHFSQPNPAIPFASSPFYVNAQLSDWPTEQTPRRAGVSSFGIGGTNAHVVLEEAPARPAPAPARPWHLLPLSARTPLALQTMRTRLGHHLQQASQLPLAEVAYTLQVGRHAFPRRCVVLAQQVSEAVSLLDPQHPADWGVWQGEASSEVLPVIFLFPGQGSQYVQMGSELYQHEPVFRHWVDRASEHLRPWLPADLRDVLYPPPERQAQASEWLAQTQWSQPALFVVEYALARLWMHWGIRPQGMLGHSLGEYVAACLAGVLSLEEALRLVAARARLMQQLPTGAMLTVGMEEAEVVSRLPAGVELAAVNGPRLCSVAGEREQIEAWQRALQEQGISARALQTSHAFHSWMMEPMLEAFGAEVQQVKWAGPQIPYVSNRTGEWISEEQVRDEQYWTRHLREPVRFAQGLQTVMQEERQILLEVGPGTSLSTLARQIKGEGQLVFSSLPHPLEKISDVAFLLKTLGHLWIMGSPVDWSKITVSEHPQRLPLPTYPFERQRHWIEAQNVLFSNDADLNTHKQPNDDDVADRLFLSSWERSVLIPLAENVQIAGWVIFQEDSPFGAKFVQHILDKGQRVIKVRIGEQYQRINADLYCINPACQEDYLHLCRDLDQVEETPWQILHLWSLTTQKQGTSDWNTFLQTQPSGFYAISNLLQALQQEQKKARIAVLSNQLFDLTGQEEVCPEKATLPGLCQAASLKYPDISCHCIDITAPETGTKQEKQTLESLYSECLALHVGGLIAYRGNSRWVQHLVPVHGSAQGQSPKRLREKGVYLIIHGFENAGLTFGQYAARTAQARLVLIDNKDLPDRQLWQQWLIKHDKQDEVSGHIRHIQALEKHGADVLTVKNDLSSVENLQSLFAWVETQFGEPHGIVYGLADIVSSPPISNSAIDFSREDKQFQTSIQGLYVLKQAACNRNLDFFLLYSPVATTSNQGASICTAAVSSFMDAFVSLTNRTANAPWTIVDWNIPLEGSLIESDDGDYLAQHDQHMNLLLSVRPEGRLAIVSAKRNPQVNQEKEFRDINDAGISTPINSSLVGSLRIEQGERSQDTGDDLAHTIAAIWQDLLGIEHIGIEENFFELGGHSLLATQFFSRLRDLFHVDIPMRQIFDTPSPAAFARTLRENLVQISSPEELLLRPVPRTADLPLSFAQQRLWFLAQLETSSSYTIPIAVRLGGKLSRKALLQSIDAIVLRHEALRTTFINVDGTPRQLIAATSSVQLLIVDLQRIEEDQRQNKVLQLASEEAGRPFNLVEGPLLQVSLLLLAPDEQVLLLTMHHIISDIWSLGIFVRELVTLYRAYSHEEQALLPELPIQYADFASCQRQWLQGKTLETQLAYWKRQLDESSRVLELPADHSRPAIQMYRGATQLLSIPQPLKAALIALSNQEGVTLFMTLLASFQTLLYRYTGQTRISVGTPIANRTRTEIERLIGFFVNTLVLCSDLAGNPRFLELLQRVREVALGAYAHQDVPFEKLVEELQPERDLSRTPLFQVMFALQNVPTIAVDMPELSVSTIGLKGNTAKFDISMDITETEQELRVALEYSTDLFEAATISRMLGHFHCLLQGIVAHPEMHILDLPLLTVAEQQQQLVEWNKDIQEFPQDMRVEQLFEGIVQRTPDAIALVLPQIDFDGIWIGNEQITYRALDRRASQLAHRLQSLGVGQEVRVGIYVERSAEMIVGVLGTLKAGGVYVPLDVAYARERLQIIYEDAHLAVLLTQKHLVQDLHNATIKVVCLDVEELTAATAIADVSSPQLAENALAYIIYTSGSTGKPKGVMVSRASLLNAYWAWERAYLLSSTTTCHLQMASFSFDVFLGDLVRALCSGGKLVICPRECLTTPHNLHALMKQEGVDCAEFVPAVLRILLQYLEQTQHNLDFMRVLLVGSDSWYRWEYKQALSVCGPQTRLINSYGVTEATIDSSFFEASLKTGDSERLVPIGRAFANTHTYVLDAQLQPVPVGVAGELYIGGAGLARGYVNHPELTAEKFIPHLFSKKPGSRLYRTGDKARYLADGTVEFLSRFDYQVKVRGFRIEIGEIEAALSTHPAVHACAVTVCDDNMGNKYLVAYVVSNQIPSPAARELINHVREQLPLYMVPSQISFLSEIPLTPNGKIDRQALPAPDRTDIMRNAIAPRNELEETIAQLWQRLLNIQEIGVYDNFFELGGHSLLVSQLLFLLNENFQIKLAVRTLFEAPTVAELAKVVDETRSRGGNLIEAEWDMPNLELEAVLDGNIRVEAPRETDRTGSDVLLLTGSTGFLGAYLLTDLLQQTSAEIYCLVRASSVQHGRGKIRENLVTYGLWHAEMEKRIIPLSGDLSQPYLGLRQKEFRQLAEQVTAIYHCGAWVNFTYPYGALKTANVAGTQEILRLAGQAGGKPVHFISTLNVFPSSRRICEENDSLNHYQELVSGYAQSKWVGEKLAMEARSRGIPVSIYRLGLLAGDTQRGTISAKDWLWTLIKACVQAGSVPDIDFQIDLTPVDYVSSAIVSLARQTKQQGKNFHLVNPYPLSLRFLVERIQACGYTLRWLPYEQWLKEMLMAVKQQPDHVLTPFLAILPRQMQEKGEIQQPQEILYDCRNTLTGLIGTSLKHSPITAEQFERYLASFLGSTPVS